MKCFHGNDFFFSSIICKDQKKEKLMIEMVNYWSSTVNDDLFYMMIKISIDIFSLSLRRGLL